MYGITEHIRNFKICYGINTNFIEEGATTLCLVETLDCDRKAIYDMFFKL
jgi:hypothetical protein